MNTYIIHPHRWLQMQDPGLARSESVSAAELALRSGEKLSTEAPSKLAVDWSSVDSWLALAARELAAAWARARSRRHAVKQIKRLDDRLLADIGFERGQIRDVVDSMTLAEIEASRNTRVSRGAPDLRHARPVA